MIKTNEAISGALHFPMKMFRRCPTYVYVLFVLTLFGFQNCAPNFNVLQNINLSSKLSGNGGGYEGKAAYYRFLPNSVCGGQETYKEMLVFDQDQIWLHENNNVGTSCQQTTKSLSSSELGTSLFQNEFLTVRDYLYARYEFDPQKSPELLAETLCRDNWEKPSFEIANHHNYRTGEATTRIYYKSAQNNQIEVQTDSATNRLLTPFEVKYQSFNLQLKYNLNVENGSGAFSRKYAGQISYVAASLANVLKPGPLVCVTGGGLDSSIWPLRKVEASSTISSFFLHPTENDLYFSDRNPNSPNWWRPFVLKNEAQLIDISQSIFKTSMYVGDHHPIPNSKWMTLEGVETDGTPYFGGNVYIYRPDDPSTLRTLVRSQSRDSYIPVQDLISSPIMQLSETEFGYWVTNRTYVNSILQENHLYRIYNWKTLTSIDYLSAKPVLGISQSLYFKGVGQWPIGKVGNLRTNQDGKYEIHYLDILERTEKVRALPIIPLCSPVTSNEYDSQRFFISQESRRLILEYSCPNNVRKVLGLSLENGSYYLTGENDMIIWKSLNSETFMVAETVISIYNTIRYNPLKIRIIQSNSGQIEATQLDPHQNTSSDSNQFNSLREIYYEDHDQVKTYSRNGITFLAAFSPGSVWNVQLKNLSSRIESTVCKNALGQKIALVNFTEEQLALVTFEPGQRVFIYEVSESENCKLLNSAPVNYSALRVLVPTKNGMGLAFSTMPGFHAYTYTKVPDDVYFLNKDGRAPLHINLNNPNFSIVVDMKVSFDHSKLYILGMDIEQSIYQTLYWLKL